MKNFSILLVIVTVFSALAPVCLAAEATIQLFDGKSLDGWDSYTWVEGKETNDKIWSVTKEGYLETTGKPFGYLHTKKSYINYKLTIVWRWKPGAKPTNSGIFIRMSEKPTSFLTKSIEVQHKHGAVGDLMAFYGATCKGVKERFWEHENKLFGKFCGVKKIEDAEKKPGEWNTTVITLKGEDVTVELNGKTVNKATNFKEEAGQIGLQSEGGPIQFKTVELTEL